MEVININIIRSAMNILFLCVVTISTQITPGYIDEVIFDILPINNGIY